MANIPHMLGDVVAQTAQVCARVLLRNMLIALAASGLVAGGAIFLIFAAYFALAESVGAIRACVIVGMAMIIVGLCVLIVFRPKSGQTISAALNESEKPSTSASPLSGSLDEAARVAQKTPSEAAVHAAVAGNYAEAVGHASAVGRQLGQNVPPAALPIAGLAIGLALAWAKKEDDEN